MRPTIYRVIRKRRQPCGTFSKRIHYLKLPGGCTYRSGLLIYQDVEFISVSRVYDGVKPLALGWGCYIEFGDCINRDEI